MPQQTGTGVRFELADSRSRNARLPKRIRVSWHGGPTVNSGEYWRLALTLKRPAGLLNFHGFDHEAWLLAQRIGASATVKDGERLAPARNAWRDAVRQRLMAVEAHGREAAWRRWCWATVPGLHLRIGRCCRTPARCICW